MNQVPDKPWPELAHWHQELLAEQTASRRLVERYGQSRTLSLSCLHDILAAAGQNGQTVDVVTTAGQHHIAVRLTQLSGWWRVSGRVLWLSNQSISTVRSTELIDPTVPIPGTRLEWPKPWPEDLEDYTGEPVRLVASGEPRPIQGTLLGIGQDFLVLAEGPVGYCYVTAQSLSELAALGSG
jgi:hypothetical protein